MAAPRFFCPVPLAPFRTVDLPEPVAHHALRVLRLKDGTDIVLFDGEGGEYPATLSVEGRRAQARLGGHQAVEAELPGRLTLVQGIASGDKMDWIIEKAVELGVSCVAPIAAQRSVLQLAGERRAKRLAHWERVVRSASEQCGRNRIMTVRAPCSLGQWLQEEAAAHDTVLLCHPEAESTLSQAMMAPANRIALLVGPEGGWSDEELETARRFALQPVQFGPRVLRTETAGLALAAAVTALKGWDAA